MLKVQCFPFENERNFLLVSVCIFRIMCCFISVFNSSNHFGYLDVKLELYFWMLLFCIL